MQTIINNCEVSIVIVCMNNLKNLYPCLESIRKYTTVSYETLVVAYLFSKENLERVKNDFPWVTFIESNEIRGFSENNNLALRQAKGKYCFVLNDDTEMKMDVIGGLVKTIELLPENVAIVSPNILNSKGDVNVSGRAKFTLWTFILGVFHLYNENKDKRYINKTGVFQTYNILGAAFLIKTDVFKKHGWFDEYYFFCPEDIALSTDMNKAGYACYVDTNTEIFHYEGMSGKSLSYIQTATLPASRLGSVHFFSKGSKYVEIILRILIVIGSCRDFIIHRILGLLKPRPNQYFIMSIGDINIISSAFSKKTPKEIFIKYYNKIKL